MDGAFTEIRIGILGGVVMGGPDDGGAAVDSDGEAEEVALRAVAR